MAAISCRIKSFCNRFPLFYFKMTTIRNKFLKLHFKVPFNDLELCTMKVVWKDTTEVGCGVASMDYDDRGYTWKRTVVVARYNTAGNMLTQFKGEVNPLKSGGIYI